MEAGLKLQPELCLLRNGHGNAQLCRHIVTAPQVGAVCLLRYSAPVGNPFEGSVQICHCRKLLTSVTPLQKAFRNGCRASYCAFPLSLVLQLSILPAQTFKRARLWHLHDVPPTRSSLLDRGAQDVICRPIFSWCFGLQRCGSMPLGGLGMVSGVVLFTGQACVCRG